VTLKTSHLAPQNIQLHLETSDFICLGRNLLNLVCQNIDFTGIGMLLWLFRTCSQFMSNFINNGIKISLFMTQSFYGAVHTCHLVSLVFDFLSLFL